MLLHELCLLVTGLITFGSAIRVDWNTNKGPIVPPTPRTTVRPLPPYREPAPVWEDQSNDIPNPNPYVYILPPPSRPRPATNNYLTSDRRPVTQTNYNQYSNYNQYGKLILPGDLSGYYQNGGGSNVVASLAARYIPNVGIKYAAVVPDNGQAQPAAKYVPPAPASHANDLSSGYYGSGDKLQGKFNPKTKKYKAYEKLKYVPLNYFPMFHFGTLEEQKYTYVPEMDPQQMVGTEQQLPLDASPAPFWTAETSTQAAQKQENQPTAKPKQSQPEQQRTAVTPPRPEKPTENQKAFAGSPSKVASKASEDQKPSKRKSEDKKVAESNAIGGHAKSS